MRWDEVSDVNVLNWTEQIRIKLCVCIDVWMILSSSEMLWIHTTAWLIAGDPFHWLFYFDAKASRLCWCFANGINFGKMVKVKDSRRSYFLCFVCEFCCCKLDCRTGYPVLRNKVDFKRPDKAANKEDLNRIVTATKVTASCVQMSSVCFTEFSDSLLHQPML